MHIFGWFLIALAVVPVYALCHTLFSPNHKGHYSDLLFIPMFGSAATVLVAIGAPLVFPFLFNASQLGMILIVGGSMGFLSGWVLFFLGGDWWQAKVGLIVVGFLIIVLGFLLNAAVHFHLV